ncbi:MAG: 4-hydroxyphenylpyruvate dioxygenase [Phycisphaeraceae bacterium]
MTRSPAAPTAHTPRADSESNPLGLRGFDHIEFIVDDAAKWADYYVRCFGMRKRAYGEPESGVQGRKAFVVGEGRINFLLAEPAGKGEHADALREHLERHGNGVKDVAFRVGDARLAVKRAQERGATLVRGIDETEDFIAGTIAAYGDVVHTFIQRKSDRFAPGYHNIAGGIEDTDIQLMMIDHVVANVEHMETWVEFYHRVFGFDQTAHFDIDTGRSALMSKVMGDEDGYIKLPINEPSSRNSQIQIFLDDHGGPGVQHIALHSSNIITTIEEMRRQGVEFLQVPDTYYEALPGRVGEIREDMERVKELGILVDRDRPDGYLLQLFTQPIFPRPTFFHEIIQRRGNSEGFGEGNFRALFEAIEREQSKRGLL